MAKATDIDAKLMRHVDEDHALHLIERVEIEIANVNELYDDVLIDDHFTTTKVMRVPNSDNLFQIIEDEDGGVERIENMPMPHLQMNNNTEEQLLEMENLDEPYDGEKDELLKSPPIQASKNKKLRTKRCYTAANKNGPPYICEECGHESPTRCLLASHRHRKHRLKERAIANTCPKCNKSFDTPKQLQSHLKRPTCNFYPKLKCDLCNKELIGLSNYKLHMSFHQKVYPHICHYCGKHFILTIHLNTHIRTKHENQRFSCDQPNCDKVFLSKHSLKNHMYTHCGQMPYKCEYCDRFFPSKGKLRWHILQVHGIDHSLDELNGMTVKSG